MERIAVSNTHSFTIDDSDRIEMRSTTSNVATKKARQNRTRRSGRKTTCAADSHESLIHNDAEK